MENILKNNEMEIKNNEEKDYLDFLEEFNELEEKVKEKIHFLTKIKFNNHFEELRNLNYYFNKCYGSKSDMWDVFFNGKYILNFNYSLQKKSKKINIFINYSQEYNDLLDIVYNNLISIKENDKITKYVIPNYIVKKYISDEERMIFIKNDRILNEDLNNQILDKLIKYLGLDRFEVIENKIYSPFKDFHNQLLIDNRVKFGIRYKNLMKNLGRVFGYKNEKLSYSFYEEVKKLDKSLLDKLLKTSQPYNYDYEKLY